MVGSVKDANGAATMVERIRKLYQPRQASPTMLPAQFSTLMLVLPQQSAF